MINRNLYMCWTGDNNITINRQKSIDIIRQKCNVNLKILYPKDIKEIEIKDSPFHESYEFLSYTHRADYLRMYLMHHYGGAYSDIKITNFDWNPYFDILEESNKFILGYEELCEEHIAINLEDPLAQQIKQNYYNLIGNGAYICKPNTFFTLEWKKRVHKILDLKTDLLKNNPASFPQDHNMAILPNGNKSNYPLRWAEICGEVFHRLSWENIPFIMSGLPRPIMYQYR